MEEEKENRRKEKKKKKANDVVENRHKHADAADLGKCSYESRSCHAVGRRVERGWGGGGGRALSG